MIKNKKLKFLRFFSLHAERVFVSITYLKKYIIWKINTHEKNNNNCINACTHQKY